MFLTLVFRNALQVIAGSVVIIVASVGKVPYDKETVLRFGIFYLLILGINIPALVIAIYARERLLSFLISLLGPAGRNTAQSPIVGHLRGAIPCN